VRGVRRRRRREQRLDGGIDLLAFLVRHGALPVAGVVRSAGTGRDTVTQK
jgi:hypothetical protein